MNDQTDSNLDTLFKPHPHPAWKEQADFLITARVKHEGKPEIKEQLWAKRLTDNRFEICCIPFFIFDLALGDEVGAGLEGEDRYLLQRIVKRSGHQTFWIWFDKSADEATRLSVIEKVKHLGCLVETCYYDLVAVDVAPEMDADALTHALKAEEEQGWLECVSSKRALEEFDS